jgi:hypothetical protein
MKAQLSKPARSKASYTKEYPVHQEDTSGAVFKDWVNTYMLPGSGLSCNAEDIWAARCGILHTLSLASRQSRKGKTKKIAYLDKQSGVDRLQKLTDSKGHDVLVVSLQNYLKAFFTGIVKFMEEILSDPDLRGRVYHHLNSLADEISFSFA